MTMVRTSLFAVAVVVCVAVNSVASPLITITQVGDATAETMLEGVSPIYVDQHVLVVGTMTAADTQDTYLVGAR